MKVTNAAIALIIVLGFLGFVGIISYNVNQSQSKELQFIEACVNSGRSVDYDEENGKPRCVPDDKIVRQDDD